MEKKILAIMAGMAMIGVIFAGCGKKNKKSQEVNKTETKAETPVESTTPESSPGFETANVEKDESVKNGNKKAKDDFDMGLGEEKKEENVEKKPNLKQKPRSKSVPKQASSNKNKLVINAQKDPKKSGKNESLSKEDIAKMEAFLKGIQQGKVDTEKQKKTGNKGAATSAGDQKQEPEKVVKSQETANQGAATPAGGEQKKQQEPEKVVKPVPNEGAAPVKEQNLVEPKKN